MVKCTYPKGVCEYKNTVNDCSCTGPCDLKEHPRITGSCGDCPKNPCKINEPSIQELCHAKFVDRMAEAHAFNCIK